jgi:hypothetical protein
MVIATVSIGFLAPQDGRKANMKNPEVGRTDLNGYRCTIGFTLKWAIRRDPAHY